MESEYHKRGFRYLELDQPVLVLGVVIRDYDLTCDPTLRFSPLGWKWKRGKSARKWQKISHQVGGVGCSQVHVLGTILSPKPEVQTAMVTLHERWFESDCGVFGPSLLEILQYRKDLRSLMGVDCVASFRDFAEGIYPIDVSENPRKTISKLATDEFPKDLDDLISWKDGWEKVVGSVGRWKLWVFGQNSD